MQNTTRDSSSDISWLERVVRWNDRTKTWNWGLIAVIGGAVVVVAFVAYVYVASYRRAAFENHVYCEVLQPGMSPEEVDVALNVIGTHFQAEVPTPLISKTKPESTFYRIVFFTDSKIDLRIGLGYDSSEKLLWITRGEVSPTQVVQCP